MKFDIFFSISQTEVDGFLPSEKVMFCNFFDQVLLADHLGFGTAWVAETHLSTETQKKLPTAVVPEFKGEIGLNTDILQLGHAVMARTKKINVGSAIRNILCNGGPVAHAEEVKTFLTLRQMIDPGSDRKLELGFASGRFDFSNRPYGIRPRNDFEAKAWPVIKGKILFQASEIFLRLLKDEELSSDNVAPVVIGHDDFRSEKDWDAAGRPAVVKVDPFWNFELLKVIPENAPMANLKLTLGSHDPKLQMFVNQFLPVGVFNLSITQPAVIEETHVRMEKAFHRDGGPWLRENMPRTCLVYISNNRQKAKDRARKAWENYWKAVDGTLDPKKVEDAVENTISGEPNEVFEKIQEKYHKDDRLMTWFDFNLHDNEVVKNSMQLFCDSVMPKLV